MFCVIDVVSLSTIVSAFAPTAVKQMIALAVLAITVLLAVSEMNESVYVTFGWQGLW